MAVREDSTYSLRRAIAGGDSRLALELLADALDRDPDGCDWTRWLDQILSASPDDANALLPPPAESMQASWAALRAYLLARVGDIDGAVALLARIAGSGAGAAYWSWAVNWIADRARPLPSEVGAPLLSVLTSALAQKTIVASAAWRAAIERLRETFPKHGRLAWLEAVGARRRGDLAGAERAAEAAHALEPTWATAAELAAVARDRGRVDEALVRYAEAVQRGAEAMAIDLDRADLLIAAGRGAEAERVLEGVLVRVPGQPEARAARWYLQALSGDRSARDELLVAADAEPGSGPARSLTQKLKPNLQPFIDYLPERDDASINVLRNMRAKPPAAPAGAKRPRVTIALSAIEAPSVRLAWRLDLTARDLDLDVEMITEAVQKPDPRRPVGEPHVALWRYDGTVASPAVSRPRPEVSEAVAELAAEPYDGDTWWADAERLGRAFGDTGVPDLMVAMIFPLPARRGLPGWTWLQRTQLAAAFAIARTSDGWRQTARRHALRALALGLMDWTTDAALAALTRIALQCAEARAEIAATFRTLVPTTDSYRCYTRTLCLCGLQLPGLDEAERRDLGSRLANL